MDIKTKKINFKIIFAIIGIIVGIASIYIGVTEHDFNFHYKGTVSKNEYGGDAYTGIQQACAQVTINTYNFYEAFQTFAKVFFIIMGILIVLHYAEKLFDNIRALKDESIYY